MAFKSITIFVDNKMLMMLSVNGDRLEIGKWQNSTPYRFKTPKPIAMGD